MTSKRLATILAATLLTTTAAHAVEATLQLELAGELSDFERRTTVYECSAGDPFSVAYINAAPNFLALVPIVDEPQAMVFTAVISASGVRYAAGKWIWWTKGIDASLYDVTLGEDAEPVLICSEQNNTP